KTMTGLILGSPRYMSPEQVIGKSLDHRTDIFSLGIVLYEALTGTAPFDGDNVNAIMYATVNNQPQPPSSQKPEIPAMLDLIIAKALAKSVDDRYQTMHELAHDLGEALRQLQAHVGSPIIAKPLPPSSKPASLESLGVGRYQKTEEVEAKPLKLNTKFDSFEATMRLAAMTNQTAEFQQYVSETKKMRAYQGATDAAPAATSASETATQQKPTPAPSTSNNPRNSLIPFVVVGVLALAAIALAVTFFLR
ncbi:MAG: protein kinase, partial [Betaproteobacteria bacterium]|nr:protein kinase [Betaproteobacteria bacterium]